MTWRQGSFTDLDVTEPLSIQGSIDGATVREGVILVLQGAITGDLVIEAGGAAQIQGTYSCGQVANSGALMVAGLLTSPVPTNGLVLVQKGSLFIAGAQVTELLENGTLEPRASTDFQQNLGESGGWLRRTPSGTFVPAPEFDELG